MRRRRVEPGVTRTANDLDTVLQLVSDALDGGGCGFAQVEAAGGSFFVRLCRIAPAWESRDDDVDVTVRPLAGGAPIPGDGSGKRR